MDAIMLVFIFASELMVTEKTICIQILTEKNSIIWVIIFFIVIIAHFNEATKPK